MIALPEIRGLSVLLLSLSTVKAIIVYIESLDCGMLYALLTNCMDELRC
jgi:hypothetical protein